MMERFGFVLSKTMLSHATIVGEPHTKSSGKIVEIVARFDHSHWSEWDSINSDGDLLLQPTNRR